MALNRIVPLRVSIRSQFRQPGFRSRVTLLTRYLLTLGITQRSTKGPGFKDQTFRGVLIHRLGRSFKLITPYTNIFLIAILILRPSDSYVVITRNGRK